MKKMNLNPLSSAGSSLIVSAITTIGFAVWMGKVCQSNSVLFPLGMGIECVFFSLLAKKGIQFIEGGFFQNRLQFKKIQSLMAMVLSLTLVFSTPYIGEKWLGESLATCTDFMSAQCSGVAVLLLGFAAMTFVGLSFREKCLSHSLQKRQDEKQLQPPAIALRPVCAISPSLAKHFPKSEGLSGRTAYCEKDSTSLRSSTKNLAQETAVNEALIAEPLGHSESSCSVLSLDF